MPELTVTHIALLVVAAVAGAVAAWIIRGNRAEQEKAAVNQQWQNQVDAQRREHGRLLDQNKSLMEQVSQYQAQHVDAKNRAKELSLAVQEAFQRRDQLQREIKDIRGNLETVLNERDQLASSAQARSDTEVLLREKDERIGKLEKELASWRDRLPPLIERFRVRNEEAERLEIELAEAQERLRDLERRRAEAAIDETRIEAVRRSEELTEGMDASNDPSDTTAREAQLPDEFADEDDEESDDVDDPADPPLRNDRDDLQMIKGVGPAIEKTLNELGIFRFRQIADMSEYDIDRVARRLKGFHSRIHREDWIGQARVLLDRAAHA